VFKLVFLLFKYGGQDLDFLNTYPPLHCSISPVTIPVTMVTKRLQQRFLLLQYHYLSAAFVVGVVAILQARAQAQALAIKPKAGWRGPTRARKRISMAEVYASLGPIYFRRSFRMSYALFVKLLGILAPAINQLSTKHRSDSSILRRAPNGLIYLVQCLGCFLHVAASASVYDIMLIFGIGRADVSKSTWICVEAIRQCKQFDIAYPTCHIAQKAIAQGFYEKSAANFKCCAGALDGLLIWTNRPTESDAALA
jgi:hypothetical protein